jgi:hypothetical protein
MKNKKNLPAIIPALDLTKNELVEFKAEEIKREVLARHTYPQALVALMLAKAAIEQADREIRTETLAKMDGSFTLDAYDRWEISRVKLPGKYEYPSQEHATLVRKVAEYKKMLADLEAGMKANGQAVAQTNQEYTIKLTERKLTIQNRRPDANHSRSP